MSIHRFVARGVTVAYKGGARALRNFEIDFTGNCLCVVGGEKDGKTTLINAIAGLVQYDGMFILDGKGLPKTPTGDNVQAVLEDYCLLKRKTVRENIEYPLVIRDLDVSKADYAIKEFGLTKFEDIKAKDLKENVKPYVAMARLSLVPRDLYIFDDIMRPLKEEDKWPLLRKFKDTMGKLGGMAIYATSSISEATAIADKIVVIYGGVIQQYGTYQELFDHPMSKRVAEIMLGDMVEFRKSVLRNNNGELYAKFGNEDITYGPNSVKYLIDQRFLGKYVYVGKFQVGSIIKYLLFDAETEKIIMPY